MAWIVVAAVSLSLLERSESIPPRTSFAQDPNVIGPWTGRRDALRVNRVLIQLGNQCQLVYYWFQQRGRVADRQLTQFAAAATTTLAPYIPD